MDTEDYEPVGNVLGRLSMKPLPEGTEPEAVFMLIKCGEDDWYARSVGEGYNAMEFLGQLVAYTKAQINDEAATWETTSE